MNPYIIVAALLAFGVSNFVSAGYGIRYGRNAEIAKNVSDEETRQKTFDAAQQGAAAAIAANRPVNTTIVQKVQREVQTNTVYTTCRVPASGMQLANQAITGQQPEPASGVGLPSTKPAKR